MVRSTLYFAKCFEKPLKSTQSNFTDIVDFKFQTICKTQKKVEMDQWVLCSLHTERHRERERGLHRCR